MQFINKTVFLTAKNKLPFKISTKLVFFYRFSICFINKDGLSKITSVLVKTFLLFSPEKKTFVLLFLFVLWNFQSGTFRESFKFCSTIFFFVFHFCTKSESVPNLFLFAILYIRLYCIYTTIVKYYVLLHIIRTDKSVVFLYCFPTYLPPLFHKRSRFRTIQKVIVTFFCHKKLSTFFKVIITFVREFGVVLKGHL